MITLIAGNSESEAELCGAESLGIFPFYPGCVSQDSWGKRGEDEVREQMRWMKTLSLTSKDLNKTRIRSLKRTGKLYVETVKLYV